ncbi:hypothetical protein [Algicella marina]|uniref:Uncharacterized protein n=1 Tax=Algicella marina TaxID=2683284 RepID=A0A6P1SWB6_9RHOB|nr:hypothetical protein [Algicella marina]QHQ34964.1 hypothetical protein GO499_07015 [Algicella marina]
MLNVEIAGVMVSDTAMIVSGRTVQPGSPAGAGWLKLCPFCEAELPPQAVVRPGHCGGAECQQAHVRLLQHRKEVMWQEGYRTRAAEYAVQFGAERAVLVPFQNEALVPLPKTRRAEFLTHLRQIVAEAFGAAVPDEMVEGEVQTEQALDRAACATCQGFCCRQGAARNAFLYAHTISEQRSREPELTAEKVMERYEASLPEVSVDGSCVFHGGQGCVLPRQWRGETCNQFHCKEIYTAADVLEEIGGGAVLVVGERDGEARALGHLDEAGNWTHGGYL